MNNYEYIIASLPVLHSEGSNTAAAAAGLDAAAVIADIREQCSARDNSLIDLLEQSWTAETLDADFYLKAAQSRNRFVRNFFEFDLAMRNAKVRYLNKALARPAGTDVLVLGEEEPQAAPELDAVFEGKDLLSREKAQDDAYWNMVDDLVLTDLFDIDIVLAFLVKLHIVDRWLKLDEQSGREMFRRLVSEVRGTFAGVNYTPDNK